MQLLTQLIVPTPTVGRGGGGWRDGGLTKWREEQEEDILNNEVKN